MLPKNEGAGGKEKRQKNVGEVGTPLITSFVYSATTRGAEGVADEKRKKRSQGEKNITECVTCVCSARQRRVEYHTQEWIVCAVVRASGSGRTSWRFFDHVGAVFVRRRNRPNDEAARHCCWSRHGLRG